MVSVGSLVTRSDITPNPFLFLVCRNEEHDSFKCVNDGSVSGFPFTDWVFLVL